MHGDATGGEGPKAADTEAATAVFASWRARACGRDAALDRVFEALERELRALCATLVAAPATDRPTTGAGAIGSPSIDAARALGQGAYRAEVDLAALGAAFAALPPALLGTAPGATSAVLSEDAEQTFGSACEALAATCAGWLACVDEGAAAERAELAEIGRVVRHDVKTPLQAASLNLELLALESAEKGIDTEQLELIQRSLDSAVEMLGRFDR